MKWYNKNWFKITIPLLVIAFLLLAYVPSPAQLDRFDKEYIERLEQNEKDLLEEIHGWKEINQENRKWFKYFCNKYPNEIGCDSLE